MEWGNYEASSFSQPKTTLLVVISFIEITTQCEMERIIAKICAFGLQRRTSNI